MMEIYWGSPMTLESSTAGTQRKVTTIEEAQYCLQHAWPLSDTTRDSALEQVEAAMVCMVSVRDARAAFLSAARAAGFRAQQDGDVQSL